MTPKIRKAPYAIYSILLMDFLVASGSFAFMIKLTPASTRKINMTINATFLTRIRNCPPASLAQGEFGSAMLEGKNKLWMFCISVRFLSIQRENTVSTLQYASGVSSVRYLAKLSSKDGAAAKLVPQKAIPKKEIANKPRTNFLMPHINEIYNLKFSIFHFQFSIF